MSNYYARAMPALGFDPAPGDVGTMQYIAGRQHDAAGELRQVRSVVEGADLSTWQGQAGEVARPVVNLLAGVLADTAIAADKLASVSQAWAAQLAGFQAEADALEKQAAAALAEHEHVQQRQAQLRLETPLGQYTEMDPAGARLLRVQERARQLQERYQAAAARLAGEQDGPNLWEKTEPYRKVLEGLLAPIDLAAGDVWVDLLKKAGEDREALFEEADQAYEEAMAAYLDGKPAVQPIVKAAESLERAGNRLGVWDAIAPACAKTAAGAAAEIRGLSYGLSALGLVADAGTLISPQDSGVMATVDRVAAGVNAAAIARNTAIGAATSLGWITAADGAAAVIPGVGEAAIVVTGAYLAGDFLYHWAPFRHVADDVGHAVADEADKAGHIVSSAWHSVSSTVGSWF
jgi:hypothetical protein